MAISPGKPLISDFIGLTLRNDCLGSHSFRSSVSRGNILTQQRPQQCIAQQNPHTTLSAAPYRAATCSHSTASAAANRAATSSPTAAYRAQQHLHTAAFTAAYRAATSSHSSVSRSNILTQLKWAGVLLNG